MRTLNLVASFAMLVLLTSEANATFIDLEVGQKSSITNDEIFDKDGVKGFVVKDKPLRDVLQVIQNESGLKVSLEDYLADIPVDAEIEEVSWVEVLKLLLRDFSVIFSFVDSDITGVTVLSGRNDPIEISADESKSTVNNASGGNAQTDVEVEGVLGAAAIDKPVDDRPPLPPGYEYIGDTRVKVNRNYPEGFRVSVIPETHPPGLTDHSTPPGAEGTIFLRPLPEQGEAPKGVYNNPPPGSTD